MKEKKYSREYFQKQGKKSSEKSFEGLSKEEISDRMRKVAEARWNKKKRSD